MVELNREGFNRELLDRVQNAPNFPSLLKKISDDVLEADDLLAYCLHGEYGTNAQSTNSLRLALTRGELQEAIEFFQETFSDTLKTLKTELSSNRDALDLLIKLTDLFWKCEINKNEELYRTSVDRAVQFSVDEKTILEKTKLFQTDPITNKLKLNFYSEKQGIETAKQEALKTASQKEFMKELKPEESVSTVRLNALVEKLNTGNDEIVQETLIDVVDQLNVFLKAQLEDKTISRIIQHIKDNSTFSTYINKGGFSQKNIGGELVPSILLHILLFQSSEGKVTHAVFKERLANLIGNFYPNLYTNVEIIALGDVITQFRTQGLINETHINDAKFWDHESRWEYRWNVQKQNINQQADDQKIEEDRKEKEKKAQEDQKTQLEQERLAFEKEKKALENTLKNLMDDFKKQQQELTKTQQELRRIQEELKNDRKERDNKSKELESDREDLKEERENFELEQAERKKFIIKQSGNGNPDITDALQQLQEEQDKIKKEKKVRETLKQKQEDDLKTQQDALKAEEQKIQEAQNKLAQEKQDFEDQKNASTNTSTNTTTGPSNGPSNSANLNNTGTYVDLLQDLEKNKITSVEQNLDAVLRYMEEQNVQYNGDRAALLQMLQAHQSKLDALIQAGTMSYEQYHNYIKVAIALHTAGIQNVDFAQTGRVDTTVFYPIALTHVQAKKGNRNDVFSFQKLYRKILLNTMSDKELEQALETYETQGINTVSIVKAQPQQQPQPINSAIDLTEAVDRKNLPDATDKAVVYIIKDILKLGSHEKRELHKLIDKKILPHMEAIMGKPGLKLDMKNYVEMILIAKAIEPLVNSGRKIEAQDILNDGDSIAYTNATSHTLDLAKYVSIGFLKKTVDKNAKETYTLIQKSLGELVKDTTKNLRDLLAGKPIKTLKKSWKEGIENPFYDLEDGKNGFQDLEEMYNKSLREDSDKNEFMTALEKILSEKILNAEAFDDGRDYYTTFERVFLKILQKFETMDGVNAKDRIINHLTTFIQLSQEKNSKISNEKYIYLSPKLQTFIKTYVDQGDADQKKSLCTLLTDFINNTPDQDSYHKQLSLKTKYTDTYLRLAKYWHESGIDDMADNMMASDQDLLKNYASDFKKIQGMAQSGNQDDAKTAIKDLKVKILDERKKLIEENTLESSDIQKQKTDKLTIRAKLMSHQDLTAKISTIEKDVKDKTTEISNSKKDLTILISNSTKKLNTDLLSAQTNLSDFKKKLEKIEKELQEFNSHKSGAGFQQNERSGRAKNAIEEDIKNTQTAIETLNKTISTLESSKSVESEEVINKKHAIGSMEKSLDALQKEKEDLKSQLMGLGTIDVGKYKDSQEYIDALNEDILGLDDDIKEKEVFSLNNIKKVLDLMHKKLKVGVNDGKDMSFDIGLAHLPVVIRKKHEVGTIKYELQYQGAITPITLSENDFSDITNPGNELIKYLKNKPNIIQGLFDKVIEDKASQWGNILEGGAALDNNTARMLQDVREAIMYNSDGFAKRSKLVKGQTLHTIVRTSLTTQNDKESFYFNEYLTPFFIQNKIDGIEHFEEQKKYVPVDDLVQYYLTQIDPVKKQAAYTLQPESDGQIYLKGIGIATMGKQGIKIGTLNTANVSADSPFIHCETTEYTGLKNTLVYSKETKKLVAPMLITSKLDETMDRFGLVQATMPKFEGAKNGLFDKKGRQIIPYNYETFDLVTYGPVTSNRQKALIKAVQEDGTIHLYDLEGKRYLSQNKYSEGSIEEVEFVPGTGIVIKYKPKFTLRNLKFATKKNDVVLDKNLKPLYFGKGRGIGNWGKKKRTDTDAQQLPPVNP